MELGSECTALYSLQSTSVCVVVSKSTRQGGRNNCIPCVAWCTGPGGWEVHSLSLVS